jgi:chromosome segregation ATPase
MVSHSELSARLHALAQHGREQLEQLRFGAAASLRSLHEGLLDRIQASAADPDADEDARGDHEHRERELQHQLEDLQEQLLRAQQALLQAHGDDPPEDLSFGSDTSTWEELKERMLQAEDAPAEADRQQQELLQQVTRAEGLLEERERLISELQQQIEQLSCQQPAEPTPADEPVDADTRIQEERERLQQLQNEWHEKLRTAELEISVERARIARERSEMEERIQSCEAEIEHLRQAGASGGTRDNPKRGRWLARLGLSRDE